VYCDEYGMSLTVDIYLSVCMDISGTRNHTSVRFIKFYLLLFMAMAQSSFLVAE